jgi:hypothetical protein
MNWQSDVMTVAATQTIVFEPGAAGGGSFWNGDSLLATLTVLGHPNRQGRLSLRDTNRALDMVRISRKQRTSYRLVQDPGQIGDAEWIIGEPSARLRYRGREYIGTRESLLSVQDRLPVITLAPSADWNVKQMELHVACESDLALVAFFFFIAYDMAHVKATDVERIAL